MTHRRSGIPVAIRQRREKSRVTESTHSLNQKRAGSSLLSLLLEKLFTLIRAFGFRLSRFFCATGFWLGLARRAARRRFIVGGVKARAFEDDLGGGDDLPQRFLSAFRAGLQRRITEGLMALKLDAA